MASREPGENQRGGIVRTYTKKIFTGKVEAPAAGTAVYDLEAFQTLSSVRDLVIFIKVLRKSTNVTLGLGIKHGPDGNLFRAHSTPIATAAPDAAPSLMSGDTGSATNGHLGEWIQPGLVVGGGAATEYAYVEVYVLEKPFVG